MEMIDQVESTPGGGIDQSFVLVELFRPLVERIEFHFVEHSTERITTSRIDRLPEWLLTYVRENFIEGGPWDLVQSGLRTADNGLPLAFLNELVRMILWVFRERNFFRDPQVCGPRSSPFLLCNAVEQLLQFDQLLRELSVEATSNSFSEVRLIGLMDTVVALDEELMAWWIEREREIVFSTLFDESAVVQPLVNHVSPRAEIFCALFRSVQFKAALLSNPGEYQSKVAVPLCIQFIDAIHETSIELKNFLTSRRNLPSHADLIANVNQWIELVNGTHLAELVLRRESSWQDGRPSMSQSDHDLARFGRSLERVQTVLVEEFAAAFVETVLMEKARFASYLMMASHLLASQEWDGDDSELSAELREANVVLIQFLQACNVAVLTPIRSDSELDTDELPSENQLVAQFAPATMRNQVMGRLAEKFLEVALDIHSMTPDVWRQGALIFARDVHLMMGTCNLPIVLRLLDITKLLSMESNSLFGLKSALGGLVGASIYLDVNEFSADGTIYEEAVSMIRAKGLHNLEFEDALSVLNRRRDLPSAYYPE